jgi:ribulose-5-phosphate 4-epimerase/fuculose-1-phosphate aldolase
MELKFKVNFISDEVPDEKGLEELKKWCNTFEKNNLLHISSGSTLGNLSFRIEDGFVITATSLKSKENLTNDSFVAVFNYDVYKNSLYVEGTKEPSSDSIMHYLIYNTRGEINAVFHGANDLILKNAEKMKLPITKNESEQDAMGFANAVLDVLGDNNFLVIKNHGFVALGRNMKEAGELALDMLKKAQKLK